MPHNRRRSGSDNEGEPRPVTKRNKNSLLDTGSIISAFSKNAPHQTINRALLRASQKEKEK